jgi:hypothetical protein
MDEKSQRILKAYTRDALGILGNCITLADRGQTSFYRGAAVQLRILLCDTTFRHDRHQDISIIPMQVPDLRLRLMDQPAGDSSEVDLQTWLDSPSGLVTGLSIRQLIRRVCDIDGGAHVEIKPLAGVPDNEDIRQWIIKVSKFLLPILTKAIS